MIVRNREFSHQDLSKGFQELRKMALQEKADDKWGSFAAKTQILIVATLVTYMIWSVIVTIFPPAAAEQLRQLKENWNAKDAKLRAEMAAKPTRSVFDILLDTVNFLLNNGPMIGTGGLATAGGIIYYKKRRAALNGNKSAMDLAIEEEMRRLKVAMEADGGQSGSSESGSGKKSAGALDGATLVELFNNFADIMDIKSGLPRNTEETASEYFRKLSEEIRFSKEKATKAATYFEDELYGQKKSTMEDKRAFMELLLEMMSKSKKA